MNKRITSLMLLAMIGLAGGCAATDTQQPTHHWASTKAVSAIEYQQDHARCQVAAGMSVTDTTYTPDSPEFSKYRQCMNTSGYALTASK